MLRTISFFVIFLKLQTLKQRYKNTMEQNAKGTPARYIAPVFPTGILKTMTTNSKGHMTLKGAVILIIVFFLIICGQLKWHFNV